MQARCRIEVAAGVGGRTRFLRAAGVGALTPRRTGPDRIHLVAAAGGPLGGDDYELDIAVGPGARLQVCTAAASVVLAAGPDQPSRLRVRAEVAEGGELLLTPGPVLLTRRGLHECENRFSVADGGRLLSKELLVLGRTGETGGRGRFRTCVDVDGHPAIRQTVTLDPDDAGSRGPAVLAGARALGQLLLVGATELPTGIRGRRAAWLPSAVPGCGVFTATSPDVVVATADLDAAAAELDEAVERRRCRSNTQVALVS